MVTKQHFEAIANIINNCRRLEDMPDSEHIDTDRIVESMADYFEEQNERFDRDRFYKACYKRTK
uniref:Uncharacterized protein n=1 Tax=viral metagenome TaxID=1070528 RepID=A0A6M3LP76_9ZZZZ